jgi:beta-phosphoglucomutase
MAVAAVIFDLDGVIVSTDEFHYQAWQALADELRLPFDREANHQLRGVSRMDSLERVLGDRSGAFSVEDKMELADRKNRAYRALLARLTPADILPGVRPLLAELRAEGIRLAIGSSSRNTREILERIGLANGFESVSDGTRISRSKPDPEVFLLAAADLEIEPQRCVVVEDALAGVAAGVAAGMRVLAIGSASDAPAATWRAPSLATVHAVDLGIDEAGTDYPNGPRLTSSGS